MKPLITLASSSPRRIDFMKQMGLPFEIYTPKTDEMPRPQETPRHLVTRLAQAKAQSIRDSVLAQRKMGLIIAADTVVVAPKNIRKPHQQNPQILGKPRTQQEAFRMVSQLAGQTHTVLTGYCIFSVNRSTQKEHQITRVIRSKVTLRALTPADIRRYIALGECMDKAGAYAAQGFGMALIESIRGSHSNVVGLPLAQVLADLEAHFHYPLFSWQMTKIQVPNLPLP